MIGESGSHFWFEAYDIDTEMRRCYTETDNKRFSSDVIPSLTGGVSYGRMERKRI